MDFAGPKGPAGVLMTPVEIDQYYIHRHVMDLVQLVMRNDLFKQNTYHCLDFYTSLLTDHNAL